MAARLASGWHPVTGQGSCLGSKPHPPLPFAVLGLIRLFDTQPHFPRQEGGGWLRERAALADSGERPERTRVIADPVRHFGRLSRGGWSSAPKKTGANPMSYKDATAFAASLAATLMVSIVVFQAGDGTHGAMPSHEYDGDETLVALEIDPWQ